MIKGSVQKVAFCILLQRGAYEKCKALLGCSKNQGFLLHFFSFSRKNNFKREKRVKHKYHSIFHVCMKLSLIFSDIEAGSGNRTDDFIDEKLLSKTIKVHNTESKKYPADLILNGDTFDFMKCPYKGKFPKHITSAIAVAKIESIADEQYKVVEWVFWILGDNYIFLR